MAWHYVEPFEGDEERVTIPFDFSHRDFVTPFHERMSDQLRMTRDSFMWRNFRGFRLLTDLNHLKGYMERSSAEEAGSLS